MSETHEQIKVCDHIKSAWKGTIFASELSGLRLPPHLAKLVTLLKSENGLTDLFIFYPHEGFHGLFIEMKDNGVVVYNKNGTLRKDKHLQEQKNIIDRLNQLGYKAGFCIGHQNAIKAVNAYMNKDFNKLEQYLI